MFSVYNDNYILPFYYVKKPDYEIYSDITPSDQGLKQREFKGQLSTYSPVVEINDVSLNVSLTLKLFWQIYGVDPWVRETNYNSQVFIKYKMNDSWSFMTFYDHESNGRGGIYERAWDRWTNTVQHSVKNFNLSLSIWPLVRNYETTHEEGEYIQNYLGYENITMSYKTELWESKISIQNLENIDRIQFIFSQSLRVYKDFGLIFQYFRGYGQSLIEYDHFTEAYGIGIRFY
ncbi:phospholipase A [Silvanigrella aquatica]|uniref:Phosphatidylcholine 1-acylhydrolase n=1 Tax=Silvanigrella aquatica TaxID=1915309 RepID=A0A1L4CZK2_9BACT|nr:phospholipase A [Silvanigrella aquatica]APJ03382.1 hypothetical protein AXG55_05465 [Silvanigrella aquatica]